MDNATSDSIDHALGFFGSLPVLEKAGDTFDTSQYRPAPDDWVLIVTDIVDSTVAIANGLHKTVNFVASMSIAALKNLCAPVPLPFLFGGDGSVVMVPPERAAEARIELARVRGMAAREFEMVLRVGMAPVSTLRRFGSDVLVGRFEPTPGNSFGVFAGGGVGLLENAARGRADPDLIALVGVPESLDDGETVDLSGLSCRWDPLRSTNGKMVTLIIHGAADPGEVYTTVMRLAGQSGDTKPVRLDNLTASWPPKGFMLEAQARRRRGWLPIWVIRVLLETLLARVVIARGRPIGDFDPARYRQQITTNTDFCKHDDTISFVIDCAEKSIAPIREYLDRCTSKGQLRYGMDVSQTALMTCLVSSTTGNLHVHFVDGGDGGYTNAAKVMKAMARAVSPGPA